MTDLTLIQQLAIWALPLIFAITMHEVAHGFVAYLFGDYTAKLAGRLTLNPIKHIDMVGTIIVPVLMMMVSNFIFGWAKPVPVDARNFKHPRRDMAIVACAGPVSNFLMAIIWALIAKIGMLLDSSGYTMIGIPLVYMGKVGIMLNVVLGVLNLIPLPPLDGGKVLEAVLPRRAAYQASLIEPFGFWILLLLMLSGLLFKIMAPFVEGMMSIIYGLFGLGVGQF